MKTDRCYSTLRAHMNFMTRRYAHSFVFGHAQYLNVPFRIRQSAKSSPRALGSKDQDLSIPRDVLMADCKLVVTRLTHSRCSPCLSLQNTHLRPKNNNIMLNGGSAGLLCILLQLRRLRRQTSIWRPRRHSDSCRR